MKHRGNFLCLIILFFLSQMGSAQKLFFRQHHLSSLLPTAETYGVHQDKKGYLWIQTDLGLCRSNGRIMEWMEQKSETKTVGVYALAEDSLGHIWLATSDGRLGKVGNDSIQFLKDSRNVRKKLPADHPYFYQLRTGKSGNVWAISTNGMAELKVGTDNEMPVLRLAPEQQKWELGFLKTDAGYLPFNNKLDQNSPLNQKMGISISLFEDQRPGQKIIVHQAKPKSQEWRNLSISFRSGFLAANANLLFQVEEGKIRAVKTFSNQIIDLYCDPNGGVWVGLLKEGVAYFPTGSLAEEPVVGLTGYSVSGICLDKENGVWATTLESGLFRCSNPAARIFTEPGLNGQINWVQVAGNYVFASKKSPRIFQLYGPSKTEIRLPGLLGNYFASSVLKETDGFLFGGKNFLIRLNERFQLQQGFTLYGKPFGHAIDQLFINENGKIMGLYNRTILRIEGNAATIEYDSIPARLKFALKWPDGKIRMGTENGLFLYENRQFKSENQFASLNEKIIIHQFTDNQNRVWLCTKGAGIWRYQNGLLSNYSRREGLSSTVCWQACADQMGRIWIATNNGLNCLDPSTNKNRVFGEAAGLPSGEITQLACLDDILYCGTSHGLVSIPISSLDQPVGLAPIWLKNVQTKGKWPANGILTANQNEVVFQIDHPSYAGIQPGEIRYRLMGLNSNFLRNASGEIRYQNLPPGHFRLEVWAGEAPQMGQPGLVFEFQVLAPFYQKWWFITLLALVLGALIWVFIRWQLLRIQRKAAEKNEVNRLLNSYQLSALQAQMNPHFIFNAINSIQQYVLTNQSEAAYRYLTRFSQLIRKVLNKSSEESHSLASEMDIINLYVELEQLRFQKRFEYQLHTDPDADWEEVEIPALLLQPYVENAIWHGLMLLPVEVQGKLSISIVQKDAGLNIRIEDNGVGRKTAGQQKSEDHFSKGMSLNKKRIELQNSLQGQHRWAVEVRDRAFGGTIVEIQLYPKEV